MNAINPKIRSASANQLIYYDLRNKKMDTTLTVNLRLKSRLNRTEHRTLRNWLIKHFKNESVKIIVEQ